MKKKKHKILKRVLIAILAVVLAIGVFFAYWVTDTYKPNDDGKAALVSNGSIRVAEHDEIVFMPEGQTPTKGLIFYPGGLVEPEAYAPLCRMIAEEGYLVIIKPMTLNLAVLSGSKADEVIKEHPEITTWAIGGHSLGGVMAADYAVHHEAIKGVVFYAAYPKNDEVQHTKLKVLSIYGSEDGVANLEKVKNAALPDGAKVVEISGGNHGNFGSYGLQKGDHESKISAKEQQEKAAKATVELLKQL